MFAIFSFTTIQSSSKISLEFVFFLVRSETELPGEASLVWASLSLRSVDVVDKGRGVILLGVGWSFASLPTVALAFPTLGLGFAELELLDAFAVALTVVTVVVGGEVRGTLLDVVAVLDFVELVLVAATNNPGFAEAATFAALFPPGVFVGGC